MFRHLSKHIHIFKHNNPSLTNPPAKLAILFLPPFLNSLFIAQIFSPFKQKIHSLKQTMSSVQEIKQRIIPSSTEKKTTDSGGDMNGGRRQKRTAVAKRGLRSLVIAVSLPVILTLLNIYFFGSNLHYATMKKSILYPPLWALHLACLGSALLMGLSGWLVWADGGFHKFPYALGLYLCQLVLGLAWDPIVFRVGASRIGLMICAALFGMLIGCIKMFKRVNPIAGDLVKPTLIWALLLTLTNLKLVQH